MAMTKKDLVDHLAKENGLTKAAAAKVLDTLAEVAKREVGKGEAFVVPGVCRASVSTRAARAGRNPRTGEKIKIAAKKVVKLAAAAPLRAAAAAGKKKR